MAGGTFTAYDKVRPGAYINVNAEQRLASVGSNRGKVATGLPLSWGDAMTVLTLEDLVGTGFFKKTGMRLSDEAALPLRLIFESANTVYLYRLDESSVKAAAELLSDETTTTEITARYGGTLGNAIAIKFELVEGTTYKVSTIVGGTVVDVQEAADAADLVDNDWVEFNVLVEGAVPLAAAVVNLTGGSNGTITADSYDHAMEAFNAYRYNVVTFVDSASLETTAIITAVKALREAAGQKVVAVLADVSGANSEAVISVESTQGIVRQMNDISGDNKTLLPLYVAGLTAAAGPADSLTYFAVPGAENLEGALDHAGVVAALKAGKFIFSRRTDGTIVVEDDNNTLVSVAAGSGKSLDWASNRVMRTLDDIATRIATTYEQSFIGKVSNDEMGASLFASVIYDILKDLESKGAVRPVDKAKDIYVAPLEKNSMRAEVAVTVNDATEKLYLTVMVG